MKKILILKNDRTGDLFTSLNTINLIFNNTEPKLILSWINLKELKNLIKINFNKISGECLENNLNLLFKLRIINNWILL